MRARHHRLAVAAVEAAGLLVTACQPLHTTTPPGSGSVRYRDPVFARVFTTKDIAYGSAPRLDGSTQTLELDLYQPTGDKVAKQLVALVYATKFPIDHLLVQSFFPTSLDNMRRLEPRIKRVFLTASKLPSLPVGIPALGNGAYSTLANYQISAPDIASLGMNKQYIAIAHRLGRQVVPWTIDDAKTLYNLRAWQPDGVITNRPDVAFAAYD